MAITWSDVTALAPALSTVAAGTQTAILAAVAVRVTEAVWGTTYTQAACALAAHLGTLSQRSGAAPSGGITSEAVGPLSRGYGTAAAANDPGLGSLGLTQWGLLYRELCGSRPEALGIVG